VAGFEFGADGAPDRAGCTDDSDFHERPRNRCGSKKGAQRIVRATPRE